MALEMKQETKKEELNENRKNQMVIKDANGGKLAEYDGEMLDVIRSTVAAGASDEELYMFLNVASMHGLNPFKKEIWFVKMPKGGNAIMTSRDGYVKIAKQDPRFEKLQSNAVYENDEFSMDWNGLEIEHLTHKHGAKERGKIMGAWAGVKLTGMKPVYVYVDFREYAKNNSFWNQHKAAMIRKVAEKEVCRLVGDISGLHVEEEMPSGYTLERSQSEHKKSVLNSIADDEVDDFIDAQIITSEMPPLKYNGDENVEKGE